MKQKEKDKILYDYEYGATETAALCTILLVILRFSGFCKSPAIVDFLILLFGASAVIPIVTKKYKIFFDCEGILIRMKHGSELRILWSEFEFYRINQEGRISYIIFVRKGRMPDDLAEAACLGKCPDDLTRAKYDLDYQVKEYSKGKIKESELLDMDAYIISYPAAFKKDVEKYWNKVLAVANVDAIVPRIRGIKS